MRKFIVYVSSLRLTFPKILHVVLTGLRGEGRMKAVNPSSLLKRDHATLVQYLVKKGRENTLIYSHNRYRTCQMAYENTPLTSTLRLRIISLKKWHQWEEDVREASQGTTSSVMRTIGCDHVLHHASYNTLDIVVRMIYCFCKRSSASLCFPKHRDLKKKLIK